MAKLLIMGVRGSADPTNAAMPFIMANGAKPAGHEAQIVLANEAVDLLTGPVAENLVPFGWPPFKEILAGTLGAKIPIHLFTRCARARGVLESDLEGKNAEFTTPPKIADLMAWADSTASF